MKPIPLLGALLLILAVPSLHASDGAGTMTIPPGDYALKLDGSPLRDPSGAVHTDAEVRGKVAALIFSVPDPSQGGRQKRWASALADDPSTRLPKAAALILVEDMAQSGFAAMARDDMKKQFTPGPASRRDRGNHEALRRPARPHANPGLRPGRRPAPRGNRRPVPGRGGPGEADRRDAPYRVEAQEPDGASQSTSRSAASSATAAS